MGSDQHMSGDLLITAVLQDIHSENCLMYFGNGRNMA